MHRIRRGASLIKVALIIVFFATTRCKLSGNPEIISANAINEGRDLEIAWKKVENVEDYALYCDGVKIWDTIKRNSYVISGPSYYCDLLGCRKSGFVCNTIEVVAYPFLGGDERRASLDLTPRVAQIKDLVSHDISGNSWVKIDFSTGEIRAVSENEVNPSNSNTAWFVLFNNSGKPELRDIETTGKGSANIRISFARSNYEYVIPYLAPDLGNYTEKITISSSGAKIFFWADNKSKGYGIIDANDYFGIIIVKRLIEGDNPSIYKGEGPYKVDIEIFIQDKVRGLRWIKY